jgi:hypothetical protein
MQDTNLLSVILNKSEFRFVITHHVFHKDSHNIDCFICEEFGHFHAKSDTKIEKHIYINLNVDVNFRNGSSSLIF